LEVFRINLGNRLAIKREQKYVNYIITRNVLSGCFEIAAATLIRIIIGVAGISARGAKG